MKIKNQLILSIMRERIRKEILDWCQFELKIKSLNIDKLVDGIMKHIAQASEKLSE